MLIINFIYIENSFIYKLKDLLKNKDLKYVIDYNNFLDKTIDKTSVDINLIIGSCIIKRLKKILLKKGDLTVYYVLKDLTLDKLNNILNKIKAIYSEEIAYNIFSDNKTNKNNFDNYFKLDDLKNDTIRDSK